MRRRELIVHITSVQASGRIQRFLLDQRRSFEYQLCRFSSLGQNNCMTKTNKYIIIPENPPDRISGKVGLPVFKMRWRMGLRLKTTLVQVYRYSCYHCQNVAARLVSGARRQDHITPVLRSLQWLPVRRRIFFKIAVLVWKCIRDVATAYLQEVCLPVESVLGRPRLRSASTGCVELSRVLTSTGQRSFSFHGPRVWNSLPSALRDDSLSLNTFSRQLKAYLFGQ